MEEKDYNPHKPAWDKSKEGELPPDTKEAFDESKKIAAKQEDEWNALQSLTPEQRLDRLDAIQAEASDLMNSRGAEFATDEQRFIVSWQREATVAAANLNVFRNMANKVEDRRAKILNCRQTLATALYKLGKLKQALKVGRPFPELIVRINEIQSAINKPDKDLQNHSCEREESEIDGKVISLDRHTQIDEVFSERHGKKVYVWQCGICGEINACAEKPERQQRYTPAMLATIHSLAKGDSPNAKGIADNPKLKQFEATTILAS